MKNVCLRLGLLAVGLVSSGLLFAEPVPLKLTLSPTLTPLMTEIRFEDREAEQLTYISRILIMEEKMRMDFGQDNAGFILFDRQTNKVWHVLPQDQRLNSVSPGKIDKKLWPKDWTITQENMPTESGVLSQVRLNNALCVEFKAAPMLEQEAGLLRDFRRLLAANQAVAWSSTPENLREPCALAVNVQQAGVEYALGFPLAIRYWDARSRVYKRHEFRRALPDLFELPTDPLTGMVGRGDQLNLAR